jgi:hypothetical protein
MTLAQIVIRNVVIDDIEDHIDDLLRQKRIIESIESYTDRRLDFGDMLETYNLINEEIERLRQKLKEDRC